MMCDVVQSCAMICDGGCGLVILKSWQKKQIPKSAGGPRTIRGVGKYARNRLSEATRSASSCDGV